MNQITRAGRFSRQPTGYIAFIPAPLPPDPPIEVDPPLVSVLIRAAEAVARLDGVVTTLPDADLFVAMYVRQEAVLSSQIEGTQSSLDDVLSFELDPGGQELPRDVEEVVNYVRAMNYGLERLVILPLSLRLIREIHGVLLEHVRGANRQPGDFRTSQNWIGPANVPLARAIFVPPPVAAMWPALDNLERFWRQEPVIHALIDCGLAHAQFETIHPFLDGNGRVGRLLITLLLHHRGMLHRPVLYLSTFLRANRAEYYDRLTAIHEAGDWESWLRFFLRGVAETAEAATITARAIILQYEEHRALVQEHVAGPNGSRLLALLMHYPLVNGRFVETRLGVTFVTANRLLRQFEALGLLEELTGGQRFRRFRYMPYMNLFASVGV